MNRKKNRTQKHQFMTYDKRSVIFKTTIVEIVEAKEFENGSFKTVFKVIHPQENEPKTCVLWERSCMQVGDKIEMKGIFKDDIFLAYSAMVNRYGNLSNST